MIRFIKIKYKAWLTARTISRFRLDNRKAKKENVWEAIGDKEYFAARLEILIKKCVRHNQLYRLQQIMNAKYAPFNGENDGWIFFVCKLSIAVSSLELRLDFLNRQILPNSEQGVQVSDTTKLNQGIKAK